VTVGEPTAKRETPTDPMLAAMAALAERLAAPAAVPGPLDAFEAPFQVLSRRHDRLVVRRGNVVLKAHQEDVDMAALAARLQAAADPRLATALLAPLTIPGAELAGHAIRLAGRWVSGWPFGAALGPADADAAPWEQAATLLARLHTAPCPAAVAALAAHPRRRLAPALETLRRQVPAPGPAETRPGSNLPAAGESEAARDVVLAAYQALPDRDAGSTARPGRPVTLIHGDWHLGQLVRTDRTDRADRAGAGGWRLVDVDDLGIGDPAWDLARPAAWFAAGLLAPVTWTRFVDAYRAAGGPALPATGDPWPAVDLPARTFVVEYAARALTASLPTAQGGAHEGGAHEGGAHEGDDDAGVLAGESGQDTGAGTGGLTGTGGLVGPDGLDPLGRAFVTCCRRMLSPVGGGPEVS